MYPIWWYWVWNGLSQPINYKIYNASMHLRISRCCHQRHGFTVVVEFNRIGQFHPPIHLSTARRSDPSGEGGRRLRRTFGGTEIVKVIIDGFDATARRNSL